MCTYVDYVMYYTHSTVYCYSDLLRIVNTPESGVFTGIYHIFLEYSSTESPTQCQCATSCMNYEYNIIMSHPKRHHGTVDRWVTRRACGFIVPHEASTLALNMGHNFHVSTGDLMGGLELLKRGNIVEFSVEHDTSRESFHVGRPFKAVQVVVLEEKRPIPSRKETLSESTSQVLHDVFDRILDKDMLSPAAHWKHVGYATAKQRL